MHVPCLFKHFSITDSEKFQRRVKKWCNEECMHGKSMLIFDKPSLLVGGEPIVKSENGQISYQINLSIITLEYICISGDMCVIKKIWENKTQSVLYKMPNKWENCELWCAQ